MYVGVAHLNHATYDGRLNVGTKSALYQGGCINTYYSSSWGSWRLVFSVLLHSETAFLHILENVFSG